VASVRREVVTVGRGVVGEEHEASMLRLGDISEEVEPRVWTGISELQVRGGGDSLKSSRKFLGFLCCERMLSGPWKGSLLVSVART